MYVLSTSLQLIEFGLIWLLRQLLRTAAIGIGTAAGFTTLVLFWSVGLLGGLSEDLVARLPIHLRRTHHG